MECSLGHKFEELSHELAVVLVESADAAQARNAKRGIWKEAYACVNGDDDDDDDDDYDNHNHNNNHNHNDHNNKNHDNKNPLPPLN